MTKRVVPAFVFLRRSDIEQQGGLLLAGNLVVEKASLQRSRTGAAISSSWHRMDAADYPQLCLVV